MRLPAILRRFRPQPPLEQAIHLSRRLATRAGEVDGTKVAASVAAILARLDDPEILAYFRWLVAECGPAPAPLAAAATAYLADPAIANLRVSGVFRTGEPELFAHMVSEVVPVTAERGPNGTTVLRGRSG